MSETFKGLKWTRVVALWKWEPSSCRIWNLGNDIVYEMQQMQQVDTGELEPMEPVFDTLAFQQAHPNPKLEEYTLSEE